MSTKTHPTISDIKGLSEDKAAFVIEYCKDLDARRAAAVAGFKADDGFKVRDEPDVALAIQNLLKSHNIPTKITSEWLLQEFFYNHLLARQQGNISASNQCLGLMAKHNHVDAFAAKKINVGTSQDTLDALTRERKRRRERYKAENGDVSFL